MNATLIRKRMERAGYLLQQLEQIEKELAEIFGGGIDSGRTAPAPSTEAKAPGKRGGKRNMSAAGRARIAAAARARWAKIRAEGNGAEVATKPAKTKKKRVMSPEARAKIAAAQKRRWANQKAQ